MYLKMKKINKAIINSRKTKDFVYKVFVYKNSSNHDLLFISTIDLASIIMIM